MGDGSVIFLIVVAVLVLAILLIRKPRRKFRGTERDGLGRRY